MSTERQQSAIKEVRDQVSLDYADGEYLSAIGANLGLNRPPFRFSDDTWRAVVRVLALTFKQIRQKFHDLFEVIFGPRITEGAILASDVVIGDRILYLNSTEDLPQLGTVILDEGTASEESIDYSFIDKTSHVMYLDSSTTFAHSSREFDSEEPLLIKASAGDTLLYLPTTNWMPSSDFPATIVVGRGTDQEEVVAITANDQDAGVLTVSPALTNDHIGMVPGPVKSSVLSNYAKTSEYLSLTSTAQFPVKGYVLLSKSSNSLAATGGTTSSVTVAANDLTADRQVGNIFVFDGNITASLAGREVEVIANTSSSASFRTTLPAAPAAGDTFSIRVRAKFTSNDYENGLLHLSRNLEDVSITTGTEVELLVEGATVLLAPVKVQGAGWDVIQSSPRKIELLIPPSLQDVNTIRSASYLHPSLQSVSDTAVDAGVSVGDRNVAVTSGGMSSWPASGQLVIDPGGLSEEVVPYSKPLLERLYDATSSTTSTLFYSGSAFPGAVSLVGKTVYVEDSFVGLSLSRTLTAVGASSVTLSSPLSNEEFSALVSGQTKIQVVDETSFDIENAVGSVNAHSSTEVIRYLETDHAGTSLQSGDLWSDPYTFPGPYVYDIAQDAPNSSGLSTSVSSTLASTTFLTVSQNIGKTALEVKDALAFGVSGPFPMSAVIGRTRGNRETITINDISIAQRTVTTVAVNATAGDLTLRVTSLTPYAIDGSNFPDSNGYRVLINRGGASEEVAWVTGTLSGPARLVVEALQNSHAAGESVELLSDVLSVDPLDDIHSGVIALSDKKERWAPLGVVDTLAVAASRGDSSIELSSSDSFDSVGTVRIVGDEYSYSRSSGNTLVILTGGGLRNDYSLGSVVYQIQNQPEGEVVEKLVASIPVTSTVGFSSSGGEVLLNFGNHLVDQETFLASSISAGTSLLTVDDASAFPTSYPYEIIIGKGTAVEELVHVTSNNGVDELYINSSVVGTKFSHPANEKVTFIAGKPEKVTYTSTTSTTFRFSPPIVLESKHQVPESVLRTTERSVPSTEGFNFPLRMPTDVLFRLQFLLDLIRAAGIQLEIIDKR